MGPLVIEGLGFAYCNIFITIDGEEDLEMGVLGFAYYNIYNTDNDEEVFDLRGLGRGRAGHFAILAILYDLRQFNLKISRTNRYLGQFNLKI